MLAPEVHTSTCLPAQADPPRLAALVLMIFFSAFFVWGVLTMQNISEQCSLVLENQYNVTQTLHPAC